MYMKRILAFSFLALMAAVSCKKDDTLRYNNITMGDIDGQTIVSDQGNTFDITESLFDVNLSSYEYGRVILSCDVLRKTADKRYDIHLTGIASVLKKEVVPASTITAESEVSVDNPIVINEIWYGGGYINMGVRFVHKRDGKIHRINLVYDDTAAAEESEMKNYTFTLRHNAFGQIPSEEEELSDYEVSTGYVSFPIAGLVKEDRAKITIKWNAHPFKNGRFDYLSGEQITKTYDWQRIGFEQSQSSTIPTPMPCTNFLVR